jgi:hypothetical protein
LECLGAVIEAEREKAKSPDWDWNGSGVYREKE